MRRVLTEPLVQFILLGAALYAALAFFGRTEELQRDSRVVISEQRIRHMSTLFTRTWQRAPTREELEGLVRDHVREEVAYREGLALGLDRDDTIIRRRIRQKLDFFAADLASREEPDDAALDEFLRAHPERFRSDAMVSFRQIYFDPERHGDATSELIVRLVDSLNRDPMVDASELGDRILLQHAYDDVTAGEVARLFGDEFAASILGLTPGSWWGPIESGYGVHAVIVDAHTQGGLPELDEVRTAVRREWENERRERAHERFYEDLLGQYEVEIQWPASLDPEPGA